MGTRHCLPRHDCRTIHLPSFPGYFCYPGSSRCAGRLADLQCGLWTLRGRRSPGAGREGSSVRLPDLLVTNHICPDDSQNQPPGEGVAVANVIVCSAGRTGIYIGIYSSLSCRPSSPGGSTTSHPHEHATPADEHVNTVCQLWMSVVYKKQLNRLWLRYLYWRRSASTAKLSPSPTLHILLNHPPSSPGVTLSVSPLFPSSSFPYLQPR